MKCEYCDSIIEPIPTDGICPNCGAKLPQNAPTRTPPKPVTPPPQIIYQVQQPMYQQPLIPGIHYCGRCNSRNITCKKRGFSWGWGLFWFFMIPVFGIFLGFCGSNKLLYRCQTCGHKWKR